MPALAPDAYVGHLAIPSRRKRWLAALVAGSAGRAVVYDARTLHDAVPPDAVEPCGVLHPASLSGPRLASLRVVEAVGRRTRRPIVVAIYARGDVELDREH